MQISTSHIREQKNGRAGFAVASTVSTIFNRMVLEKEIKVRTESLRSHESLRVSLVHFFSKHKTTLKDIGFDDESCTLSVCAHYDLSSGVSHFRIAKRKLSTREYEIVESENSGG